MWYFFIDLFLTLSFLYDIYNRFKPAKYEDDTEPGDEVASEEIYEVFTCNSIVSIFIIIAIIILIIFFVIIIIIISHYNFFVELYFHFHI